MHYLHPRSRTTGTLFTTTLAVSFLVVGLPHLLPCPVDRRKLADSVEGPDGKIRRRRRRSDANAPDGDATTSQSIPEANGELELARRRECPVPKPGGVVGQIMGFEQREKGKPVEVVVKSLWSRGEGE